MKHTTEQKALAACREYVRLNKLVRDLTRQIGDALLKCPGSGEYRNEHSDEGQLTHLHVYYRSRNVQRDSGVYGMGPLHGEAEFIACNHCLLADGIIQQRKQARLSLGAAKRQITKIGKVPA